MTEKKIDNVGRLKSATVGVFTSYKFEKKKDSNQNLPLSVELVAKHLLEWHGV